MWWGVRLDCDRRGDCGCCGCCCGCAVAVLWLTWLCVCTCCACDGASRRPPRAGARHASRRARAGARVIVVTQAMGRACHTVCVRSACVAHTCVCLQIFVTLASAQHCMTIAWRLHGDCMATAAAATTQASERRQSDCRGQTASLSWDCLATASLQASETRRFGRGQTTSFTNGEGGQRRPVFIAHKIKS